MAYVVNDPNNRKRVIFKGLDGKRRTIRLGKMARRDADAIAGHVDAILSAALSRSPIATKTAEWLGDIPDTMYAKLVAAGLVNPREVTAVDRLGEHLDAYFAKRTDMKPASRLVLGHVVRNLRDYFSEDRALSTITAGDADDFSRWLVTGARKRGKADKSVKGLSPATIGKRLQWCSAIFRDAMRRKIITDNPFFGLKQPKATNPERKVYVPAENIEKVIEATADPEWKLLLSLARYLGLRIPSEAFSLTWDCIDWERGRIRIPSPKTEVHDKSFRIAPILPEVRPHLDRLFFADVSPNRSVYVLAGLRSRESAKAADRGFWANLNLRQHFLRLLGRAGVKPWPKLWHNLRASAQTDLTRRFPIHVVCDWLGNSVDIAREHYLQVTDADFEAALIPPEKAARNPARLMSEPTRIDAHREMGNEKTPCFQGVRPEGMAGAGFEPTTSRL